MTRFQTLRGATGTMRVAEFNGREHLVVPVVAMVEGVVWASNSPLPELVPAEELAVAPQQWNGRPCFAGHPAVEGTSVSANTPAILEQSFGTVFKAASTEQILESRKLTFEAWLDPQRAGTEAQKVLQRLQAGERVEVSVGCFVNSESVSGHFNGQEYQGVWRHIVSDHLAFLSAAEVGACSVDAGCGAPRQALQRRNNVAETKFSWKKLIAFIRSAVDEGLSDRSKRDALYEALRAVEPGFLGIEDVFETQVVYAVSIADRWVLFRRSYSMDEAGVVTLVQDAEAVKAAPVTYEPVTESSEEPVTESSEDDEDDDDDTAPVVASGTPPVVEPAMSPCVERIIAASGGQYTEADAHWLSQVPVNRLSLLCLAPKAPLTEDEFMALAPTPIREAVAAHREAVAAHQQQEAAQRQVLVAALKPTYAEEELVSLSLPTLLKLSQRTEGHDYSGRGVVPVPVVSNYDPPDPYQAALKALQTATH